MSGGVDSSVSAALLKEQGFKVVGIHLKCWNIDGCADQDAEDARRAAEVLQIPFYTFDFEKEYKERVVEYMVEGYRSGITPNPDVMCNHEIKFGLFFQRAMQLGADYVATGHYAKTKKGRLYAGRDKNKDQSYFLWRLTKDQLLKSIFPLGDLKKPQVRKLAKKHRLPNALKKDSQGVCFLGEISLPVFLEQFIPMREGEIIASSGEVLGNHKGAHQFTIGQRRGLKIGGLKEAHYVIEKDLKANTVVLGLEDDPKAYSKEITLTDCNFLAKARRKVLARIRYRQPLQKAELKKNFLVFEKAQKFVAEGQSAVFYDSKGEELLGGGVIAEKKSA